MARVVLAPQTVLRTGLTPAYTAAPATGANNGNTIVNAGKMMLHVKNGGGSPCNVTVDTPGTVDSLAVADRVVAVPAGGERMIGPFPIATYNQTGGFIAVDYDFITSVTVGAFIVA